MAAQAKSRVQSVSRACQLLRFLGADLADDHSVLGLSRAIGLDRTIVYRLLRTLVDNGLVEESGGRYAIGPGAATLGLAYIEQTGLRQAALPYAVELHTELAETPWIVSLAIPAGDCAILIERLWKPAAPLSTLIDLGSRLSLERTAIGRCFLAYDAADSASKADLSERLERIRAAGGIEFSANEVRPGIAAMASIVQNRRGVPVGAIAVSGPDLEPELTYDSTVARRLARTASSISQALR